MESVGISHLPSNKRVTTVIKRIKRSLDFPEVSVRLPLPEFYYPTQSWLKGQGFLYTRSGIH